MKRYAACPKCGHAPLPEDQSLPAACPACGVILAKFGQVPVRATEGAPVEEESLGERLRALLLPAPPEGALDLRGVRWATLAAFVAWTLWIWYGANVRTGSSGSTFLHLVLLPFHEAGHYAIFRWFGAFIMTLGGTLGQHLLPIVAGVALLRRGDAFGAGLCLWLLGYSTIDMAVYMYDAFDPQLTLLGGRTGAESDGHDWQNLFGDMGLLRRARGIGLCFQYLGMAVMAAGLAWAAIAIHRRATPA